MCIHYLVVALRNFRKNYLYATLNMLGLAVGFAAFILIAVYLHYETSYENFHTQAERIYRPTYRFQSDGNYDVHWARIPVDYINELATDLPEVEALIRFQNYEKKYVRVGHDKFAPAHAYVTDPEVFEVFDFPLVAGDAATALLRPRSVVLTESVARRYFGHVDALGKELYVTSDFSTEETPYVVTGVMKDTPGHTHLPVDLLFSFQNPEERSGWAYVYMLLREGARIADVEAKMPDFVRKYATAEEAADVSLVFQPMAAIHLHSDLAREIVPNGNRLFVILFFFVGGLVLLIPLINYVNLSSALAISHAQEIGVRSVLGATRQQRIVYACTEATVYHMVAVGLGGLIAHGAFPHFQHLTGAAFLLPVGWFALAMGLVAVLCGLLSGIYPALILMSFRPLDLIRQHRSLSFSRPSGSLSVKRSLVALQFGVSILLVASALVAYDQFRFLNEKNLGLQPQQILAIPNVSNQVTQQYATFREQVSSLAGVQQVAACMQVPSEEIRDAGPVFVAGVNNDPRQAPIMDVQIIDPGFIDMMDIQVLAGEDQSRSVTDYDSAFVETAEYTLTDYLMDRPRTYLINETAMTLLGWTSPEEAIGQSISWSIGDLKLASGPITGVVQDFHQETLKNQVDPTVLVHEPIWLRTFLVKINTPNLTQTVAHIQAIWDDLYPAYPMNYHFLDDLFEKLYRQERVQLQLLTLFSGLAVLIAFLGLFSLVAYSLKIRVREMAIRRVLGATRLALIRLISHEYLAIMLAGAVIALPTSYWVVSRWLRGFAYHVEISMVWYVVTLGLISALLLITVSLQTRISTSDNPADVLKDQ